MTATLEARFRRIAQVLEQRGAEVKLLDRCKCAILQQRWGLDWYKEPTGKNVGCEECSNTGTVVPSQEVCFYRLVLAGWWSIQFHTHIDDFDNTPLPWNASVNISTPRGGHDPLDALMRAAEQALGIVPLPFQEESFRGRTEGPPDASALFQGETFEGVNGP